jgi:hypothetical protein
MIAAPSEGKKDSPVAYFGKETMLFCASVFDIR